MVQEGTILNARSSSWGKQSEVEEPLRLRGKRGTCSGRAWNALSRDDTDYSDGKA